MQVKKYIKKFQFEILFGVLGAVGGYLYWYYVGCLTGTCPLKKVWYYDVFLGVLIGLLLADIVKSIIKKKKNNYEK